jgi:hypothetical protein
MPLLSLVNSQRGAKIGEGENLPRLEVQTIRPVHTLVTCAAIEPPALGGAILRHNVPLEVQTDELLDRSRSLPAARLDLAGVTLRDHCPLGQAGHSKIPKQCWATWSIRRTTGPARRRPHPRDSLREPFITCSRSVNDVWESQVTSLPELAVVGMGG